MEHVLVVNATEQADGLHLVLRVVFHAYQPAPARRRALLQAPAGDPSYSLNLHTALTGNPGSIFVDAAFAPFGGVSVLSATHNPHTLGVGPAPPEPEPAGHYVGYDWYNPSIFSSLGAPYGEQSFVIYLTMRWENATLEDSQWIGQEWLDVWHYGLGKPSCPSSI